MRIQIPIQHVHKSFLPDPDPDPDVEALFVINNNLMPRKKIAKEQLQKC